MHLFRQITQRRWPDSLRTVRKLDKIDLSRFARLFDHFLVAFVRGDRIVLVVLLVRNFYILDQRKRFPFTEIIIRHNCLFIISYCRNLIVSNICRFDITLSILLPSSWNESKKILPQNFHEHPTLSSTFPSLNHCREHMYDHRLLSCVSVLLHHISLFLSSHFSRISGFLSTNQTIATIFRYFHTVLYISL